MISQQTLEQNLASVRDRIARAMDRVGRTDAVTLVAVTKGQSATTIAGLLRLGIENIGESYLDESISKQTELKALPLKWHMIGHIQSRKAKQVVGNFQLIHSVDSLKLAERISKLSSPEAAAMLLECNIGAEPSKHGWAVSDKKEQAAFFSDVEAILGLPNLSVQGLMSMAPVVNTPEEARPFFAKTRELRDELAKRFTQSNWNSLSMGMSDDFEAAILEGATLLRIGTALFGPRILEE